MFVAILLATLSQYSSLQFAEILDIDGDGIINPMEAAEAIHMLNEENGTNGVHLEEIANLVEHHEQMRYEYAEEFISDFDRNRDGAIQIREVPRDLRGAAVYVDRDKNRVITVQELLEVSLDSDEAYVAAEVFSIFKDYDEEVSIAIKDIAKEEPDFAEYVQPFDSNNDGQITREEMTEGFLADEAPASFEVDGSIATMTGVIGSSTPFRVMELVMYHPSVTTIVMEEVPGSIDDDFCLRAARIVRAHGLNTHVPSGGAVESGGTDFFQAGVKRTCVQGAKFGIHSWAAFGEEGADYPKDSEEHDMYLEYCDDMGIPRSFYWRTLEAASADDIHYMTEEELFEFKMLTEPIEVLVE